MILMGKFSGFCHYVVEIWVMFTIIQLNLFCLAIVIYSYKQRLKYTRTIILRVVDINVKCGLLH